MNNIHLILHGDLHVQQALAMVATEEAYTEVLQLEFESREEGDDQPPWLQAAWTNAVLEAAVIKAKEKHVEGDSPPHFPDQADYSLHASTSLCLDNQEQYSRISHYINFKRRFWLYSDGSWWFLNVLILQETYFCTIQVQECAS